jgi:hypothetical protein
MFNFHLPEMLAAPIISLDIVNQHIMAHHARWMLCEKETCFIVFLSHRQPQKLAMY